MADIEAIRARHGADEADPNAEDRRDAYDRAHADRSALLSEVDRLTALVATLRAEVAGVHIALGCCAIPRKLRAEHAKAVEELRAKLEQAEAARAEAERALATCRETLDEERRDVDTLGAKLEAAEKRVAAAERGFASIDAQMRGYRDHAEGLEKRLAALDVAVPVDVEGMADDLEDVFKRAADDAFSVGELATRSGIEEVVRRTVQHVARAMMTERVLAVFRDAKAAELKAECERRNAADIEQDDWASRAVAVDDPVCIRAGMRAALEALGGVVDDIPSDAEGAEAVERLGIDVPQWAAEVRAKVETAVHCRCGCAWRKHPDGTLSLWDQDQRPCAKCDNGPSEEPERRPCPHQNALGAQKAEGGAISPNALSDIVVWCVDRIEEAERARRGGAK